MMCIRSTSFILRPDPSSGPIWEVVMVQARSLRQTRPPAGAPPAASSRTPRVVRGTSAVPTSSGDIQDALGSITDRDDLEQLFARHVDLPRILQLMGRHISREQIHDLLKSPHLEHDLKRLLD
jgi:hypothetical protein